MIYGLKGANIRDVVRLINMIRKSCAYNTINGSINDKRRKSIELCTRFIFCDDPLARHVLNFLITI